MKPIVTATLRGTEEFEFPIYSESDLKYTGSWFIDGDSLLWVEVDTSYRTVISEEKTAWRSTGKWWEFWKPNEFVVTQPARYWTVTNYEYLPENQIVQVNNGK